MLSISLDMMMLVAALALAIRLIAVRHAKIAPDTYGHLYYAKEVKAQKAGPFGEIVPKVVGATSFRHPFLLHWLVAFFDIKHVLRCQKWINPTLDALFAVGFYTVLRQLEYTDTVASLTALLYLLTPMWFSRLSIGPRISSFTPRLASELGVNLFFIVLMLPLGLPAVVAIGLGGGLGAFVLLISKFGLQAMLFLTPLTALIALDWIPMAALGLSLCLAFAVTGGQYVQTVASQLNHLVRYFRKNLYGDTEVSNRNSWSRLVEGVVDNKKGLRKKFGALLGNIIVYNSYTAVAIKMPALVVTLTLSGILIVQEEIVVDFTVLAPVIASSILFMTINWRPLLFLGEAERYPSHVAFFITLSCVTMAEALNALWIVWLLLGYGLMFWINETFVLHRVIVDDTSELRLTERNLVRFLTDRQGQATIVAYPYNAGLGLFRTLLETDNKVVYPGMLGPQKIKEFDASFDDSYPYVRLESLDKMAEDMGVDVVIANRNALAKRGHSDWAPSSQWKFVNIGSDDLLVYQRAQAQSIEKGSASTE